MREGGLKAIQELVTGAATSPGALTGDASWSDRVRRAVAGNSRLSPAEQLEIYREQFWGRHQSSLDDDFIVARHLLGDCGYRELTKAYLEANPPETYDLRALGRRLPDFTASRAPYAEDALLLESMRLDWAFMAAFDAPDAPPFDASVLAAVPEDAWPSARIALHPSLQLLALAYPVHAMRDAVRRGEKPERVQAARTFVAVYRRADWLKWMELEPAAHALLQRLARGEALGAACEAIANEETGDVGAKLGAWFQTWTAEGWIAAVDV